MKENTDKNEVIDLEDYTKISDDIEFNENNIINQDNKIYNFQLIMKIAKAELNQKVCKLLIELDQNHALVGSGFFCYIPSKKMKVLITNNHLIDQDFLNKGKKIKFSIEIDGKQNNREINLEVERFKNTNKTLDFTVIEILENDYIESFFEINESALLTDEDKKGQIFALQYPKGGSLQISFGNIIEKKINFKNPEFNSSCFIYNIGTESGSSGSPIISENDFKVIGLHKAGYGNKIKDEKINLGIYLNKVIESIPKKNLTYNKSAFYCKYEITEDTVDKKIPIFNNEYKIVNLLEKIIINQKEESIEK